MPRISFGFDTLLDFSGEGLRLSDQDTSSEPLGLRFELAVGQGPTQFTIKPSANFRFSLADVLGALASVLKIDALNKVATLTDKQPWALVFNTKISPEISVLVSSTESVAQCILTLYDGDSSTPGIQLGGQYGPITIEPKFTVFNLIISYNKNKGGLDVSAKVQFDDQPSSTYLKTSTSDQSKTQIVKFPFPVPDQGTSTFKLNYLGLGQRFGPPLPTNVNDFSTALQTIFAYLEKNLTTNDPQTILEKLVKDYYHPDRDWFVAADLEFKGWQVRLLFNDPVLYGVEVSCSVDAFKGLDLIILYVKLGPHLGVYYGKLTIPEQYRQINLGAVALTLPTVQIWIYTNGDFKVNVGWPLGSDSIGIQVYIFTGGGGFYFGKLRSGDNPQTQNAPVQYNPIFVFGLGLWLGVGRSFTKGPLSANLSLTVQGTFQGILAWQESNNTSNPPDYYWFAATVGLVGTLQGEVDLKIIKISLLVRLTATAGIAFETDYNAVLNVSASVEVKASVKVLFVKVSVSFKADVSQTFVLSHGGLGDASLNGPQNPSFKNLNDGGAESNTQPLMQVRRKGRYRAVSAALLVSDPPTINLSFVLYPAATYTSGVTEGQSQAVALLLMSSPEYGASNTGSDKTAWELLLDAYASWLLEKYSGGTNSWELVLEQLNNVPPDFEVAVVEDFLANRVHFSISGVDLSVQSEPVNMAFFPILPNLQMEIEEDNQAAIRFDQPTVSADFLNDLSTYAAQFSVSDLMSDATDAVKTLLKAFESGAVSLNSLLFTDYFLMIGQQLAQQMSDEAPEEVQPGIAISSNIAGFVSRFLLNGLVAPTLDDNTKWSGLYELTGQQFAVNVENPTTSANLAINSLYLPIAGQPDFSKLDIQIAADPAVIPVAAAPAQPDTLPALISLTAPLSPAQLWIGVRNRLSWQADGQAAQFIVPLPNRIQQLLNSQPLSLAIQTDYPHEGQSGNALAGTPGLLIGIKLFQIKQNETFNIDDKGQTESSYLPFVYTIGGADEETRDRIEALLTSGALTGASISLLYNAPNSGYLSDQQNPQGTFLVKTNLSTSSEPTSLYATLRFKALAQSLDTDLGPVSALQSDLAGFLRIVWENSIVNAGGFFLYYNNAANQDFPDSMFVGGQADLQLLVSFPANTLYQKWHNVLVTAASEVVNALYIGPATAAGVPLQDYQPTHPTGCIAFEANPAARLLSASEDDPTIAPYSEESIAQLYHLLQYQISANAGQGLNASGWSPSVSPTQQQSNSQGAISPDDAPKAANPSTDAYGQVVPVYNFIQAAAPSGINPLPNIYAAIGAQSSLQFRMGDVYGNMLGASALNLPFEVQYADTIWSVAEWPGVSVAYRIGFDQTGKAALTLETRFDPSQVLRNFGSNAYVVEKLNLGDAPGNNEDLQQQAQIALYKLYFVLHQLNDPHTHWQVSTTLFAGASGDPKGKIIAEDSFLKSPLTSFAGQVVNELNKVFNQGTPQPLSLNLPIAITPSDIAGTEGSIIPVSVWMTAYRDGFLPNNADQMPNLASNAFVVKPQATSDQSDPSSNITAFAQDFEKVFNGFDGTNGLVKLAARTGNPDFSAADTSAYLWAVKWSNTKGLGLKFKADDFTYFTLAPLSNQLLPSEQAQITIYDSELKPDTQLKTFTNVDVDAAAINFLNSTDELLDPELAAAMAKADSANYANIMEAKANLAAALKKGLIPVFVGKSGEIASAMDCFEQALLSKLSTAYTVSAVVQAPVTVQNNGDQPGQEPRLFGSITAGDGDSDARDYTLTNAKLELTPTSGEDNPGHLNFLATAKHPQTQADLDLDLSYNPVFIEHLLQNEQTDFGYTPSSWLRYILADNQEPAVFGLGTANIPVPLRQYPQNPVLESQSAKGAGDQLLASKNPVEDALKWKYQAAVVPAALNAQDELWFDLIYNLPVTNLNGSTQLKAAVSPLVALFQSLAAFNAAYGSLRTLFLQQAEAAISGPVPNELTTMVGILTPLIQDVASAYTNYMASLGLKSRRLGDSPEVIRRHFVLSFKQISSNTLTLYGDSAAFAEYPASINGQAPNGTQPVLVPPANAPGPGDWYVLQYPYAADPTEPNRLTALWPDIDAVTRQTALTQYWVVRNADLGAGDQTVDPRIVYTTAQIAFANPVLPLVRIADVQATTFPALSDTLSEILAPFISAGSASVGDRLLKLESNYAYNLLDLISIGAAGQQIWVPASINLIDDLYLSEDGSKEGISLAQFACDLAKQLDTWHQANKPLQAPAGLQAKLSFNITLFAVIDQSNLPLIKAENIYVNAPVNAGGWWMVVCK